MFALRETLRFSLLNKFVRTKMRLKLGTKIDLSERFVRFVRLISQICQILFSSDSMSFPRDFRDLKKTRDGRTDGPTNGRTDPLIEMHRGYLKIYNLRQIVFINLVFTKHLKKEIKLGTGNC